MRLVDADELLSYIDRVNNCGLGKKKSIEYINKYISNMTTAFDVDKIVKDIEKLQEKANENYYIYDECMIEYDTYEKTLDIVKRGGIDE